MSDSALLISRSCTTGWRDWVHGELWLTSSALVRCRLSLAATLANGSSPSLPAPVESSAAPGGLAEQDVRAAHRTNRYLRLVDITDAHLKRGALSDRLVVTANGRRHTLLWMTLDPAYDVLRVALGDVLHGRLRVD